MATLPAPRGALTAFLRGHLTQPVHGLPPAPESIDDPVTGDDAALALYVLYELTYRGWDDVDDEWEWEPTLIALRRRLEDSFLVRLRSLIPPTPPVTEVGAGLEQLLGGSDGPSLSTFMVEAGTDAHMQEFAIHRSAYQLKEADPHTWALPRLHGEPKAAMVEIQADEYGEGVEAEMHATLFARTMRALGLDSTYGAYVDVLPGITLSTCNLISLFGLHRKFRAAAVGHLAVFEMTSVLPMGRYSAALERLGYGVDARRFYDVHVTADAHHQVIALERLARGLVRQDPAHLPMVLFGAASVMAVEGLLTSHLLDSWRAGRSSLRQAVAISSAA
jgi:hypothetical protein